MTLSLLMESSYLSPSLIFSGSDDTDKDEVCSPHESECDVSSDEEGNLDVYKRQDCTFLACLYKPRKLRL